MILKLVTCKIVTLVTPSSPVLVNVTFGVVNFKLYDECVALRLNKSDLGSLGIAHT